MFDIGRCTKTGHWSVSDIDGSALLVSFSSLVNPFLFVFHFFNFCSINILSLTLIFTAIVSLLG